MHNIIATRIDPKSKIDYFDEACFNVFTVLENWQSLNNFTVTLTKANL